MISCSLLSLSLSGSSPSSLSLFIFCTSQADLLARIRENREEEEKAEKKSERERERRAKVNLFHSLFASLCFRLHVNRCPFEFQVARADFAPLVFNKTQAALFTLNPVNIRRVSANLHHSQFFLFFLCSFSHAFPLTGASLAVSFLTYTQGKRRKAFT